MPIIFKAIIIPLIIHLLVESIILLPYFHYYCKSTPKLFINLLLINCITHLTLYSFLILTAGENRVILVLLLILLPLIEACLIKYVGVNKDMKSIIQICYFLNVLSYICIFYLFFWRELLTIHYFNRAVTNTHRTLPGNWY